MGAQTLQAQGRTGRSRAELGAKLFAETEFNDPGNDFSRSCSDCHALGRDPRTGKERFYADSLDRSLLPGVATAQPEWTLRNTPTLIDTDLMTRFYYDGRYDSLEDLIREKIVSDHFGWRPERREAALGQIHQTLLAGLLVDYQALFASAYQVDVTTLERDEAIDWLVRALAYFFTDLVSEQTSLWDAFADMNRIPLGPSRDETPKQYAGRVAGRIGNQEGRVLIKRPIGFSKEAYVGFKTFFRVDGEASVGNCVSCHVPPELSDFQFHNTGIAALDFDQANGDGAFDALEVPGPEADRPLERFLSDPRSGEGHADLGYWNFVDLESPQQLREGETEASGLERTIGAFKTPTLRNLQRTGPYMHNGAYDTIEEAVREIVRVNQLARAHKLRAIDEDYQIMHLSEADIGPLTAFLETFDEVDVDEFRELLIAFEDEAD